MIIELSGGDHGSSKHGCLHVLVIRGLRFTVVQES